MDNIAEMLPKIGHLDSMKLFYLTSEGELIEKKANWSNGSEIVTASYELWKDHSIKRTIAVYPSFLKNASNGETSNAYVIEIEDSDLTGTCRMFFDNPLPTEMTDLQYIERN